ncbi:MAG TPA: serine hydrolase domain-containing protein [Steroidobacteraceae bacterium]|nr:serine hydrolase domain-containing protein [Steroidobacteraceae bacterium]
MRRVQVLLPALLSVLITGQCPADTVGRDSDAAASAKVDALFARFTRGVQPGAGVLVVENGRIVHEATYGYADLERRIPLSVDATFRLDSVSKQFTAMAIMLLKEEGRLAYDDPISKYLPELSVYPGVTIRNLLTHTGGLPDYYDEIVKTNSWPSNADARVLLGQMAKPEFAPGSRYEYSNAGYDMLGEVVASASGMRFKDFVEQRVFAPLGMTHSLIHDTTRPTVPRRVLGYDKDGKGFKLDDEHPLNGIIGAGGVFTTLDDLYLWDQALYGEKLVKHATLDEAFTGNVLNDGKRTDYGFGWRISEYHHTRRISHGGSWVGFRSHIARHPDIGLTIVILANRGDVEPDRYVDRITDIYMAR